MGRTVLVVACVALAMLVAGGAALVASSGPVGAAFPGQNGKIVFASDRTRGAGVDNPEGDTEIFTVNPDGSGLQQVTRNIAVDDAPAYSPDGTEIAFKRGADIWRLNADGSGQTQLTDTAKALEDSPAFSPSGNKIVFSRGFEDEGDFQIGRSEIYKMNALDGSDLVRLTNTPKLIEDEPAWSPGGTKIAFDAHSRRVASAIYKINASDGSARTRLTRPGILFAASPNWSPKGARIAFTGFSFSKQPGQYDIHRMKPDGSGVKRLTANPAFDYAPAWSPDGQEIAFRSDRLEKGAGPVFNIFRMQADGSEEVSVTRTQSQDAEPDWQPIP